jgi:cytochrome c-type biogenesis protein CcmH/NrfG
MKDDDFTEVERQILQQSGDLEVTRRHRTTIIVSGVFAAGLLCLVAYGTKSWRFVLIVSLIYVGLTLFEKVAYANAVIAYKSLIQKLRMRVDETEKVSTP